MNRRDAHRNTGEAASTGKPALRLHSPHSGGKPAANGATAEVRGGHLQLTGHTSVVAFVKQMLQQAIALGASDVHLEKYENRARLRYRLDGVLQEVRTDTLLLDEYTGVSTRVKLLAGLDIAERRLPQDGRLAFEYGGGGADVRVSVVPLISGERIVLRILDSGMFKPELDALGMTDGELTAFRSALHASQGMILVTGPTGSGKTTTLYAAIHEINNAAINILTAEDPVEYRVEGVNQVEVKENIGLGFSGVLRSFLRQDPEVILVGEIRDFETADIAMKAALTGHLVMSTLHTRDVAGTITRLINIGLPEYLVGAALSLVVSQRLVRKTCPRCRSTCPETDAPPLPRMAAETILLSRGSGCEHCGYTGYAGRRAVYEILEIDDELRRAVANYASSPTRVVELTRTRRLSSLREAGVRLLRDGTIAPEEYARVLT